MSNLLIKNIFLSTKVECDIVDLHLHANCFMCMQLKEYLVEACKLHFSVLDLSNNLLTGLPLRLASCRLVVDELVSSLALAYFRRIFKLLNSL